MILSHGYVAQRAAREKRLAEERAAKDRATRARADGRREGKQEERRRHELAVVAGEDAIKINPPANEFVRIALAPRRYSWDASGFDHDPRYRAECVLFRARKKAWQSPEGHTVVWWDWEFAG